MMHKEFPALYVPQYTLVSFSPDVPYADAYNRGFTNDALLNTIMGWPNIEQNWDSADVRVRIADMLHATA